MWQSLIAQGAQQSADMTMGIINALNTNRNIKRQNQYNKEMAKYQYSLDLDMWNRANLYNTPAEQMKRLKSAGLNPNLVYGNGTVTGNTMQATLPKYNAPEASFDFKVPEFTMNVLGSFMDLQIKQAQLNNIKASTEGTKIENLYKSIVLPVRSKYEEPLNWLKVVKGEREADILSQRSGILTSQDQMLQERARVIRNQIALELQNMTLKNNLIDAQGRKTVSEAEYAKLRNDLLKLGISPGDNPGWKIAVKLLNSLGFVGFDQLQNY